MFKLAAGLPVVLLTLLIGCSSPEAATSQPPEISATPQAPAPTPIAPTTDPLADTTVIPGQRVGPITPQTSRQDLSRLFGEAKLQDQDVGIGEGESEPGTRIELGPERSLSVVWADASRTQAIAVRQLGPAWRTPQGLGLGSSFADLQAQLGPFELFGFGWDYGGTVLLANTQLAQYQETLILRLYPTQITADGLQNADYKAVLGDGQFASTNPHMQALQPKVVDMVVRLAPPTPPP